MPEGHRRCYLGQDIFKVRFSWFLSKHDWDWVLQYHRQYNSGLWIEAEEYISVYLMRNSVLKSILSFQHLVFKPFHRLTLFKGRGVFDFNTMHKLIFSLDSENAVSFSEVCRQCVLYSPSSPTWKSALPLSVPFPTDVCNRSDAISPEC